ncbi:stage II sporulation protein D [Pseudoflavonifractor phocaeensis]|uniref:stage II sporulation protein D n=1 Tax=Pseudoflavonifractor phocaeensis TaxID=1870988 RepID=UPI001A9C8D6F|nr:stage II sporulation protein D [Pseudoflavonifractor phocaeensis]
MKNNLQNYGQRWGVKQVVATALALLLVLFLLPLLLFGTGGLEQTEQAAPTGELPIDRTVVTPSPSADSQTQIRVALTDGSVLTLGLDQYLWRVVAAEMPASFELEALKAQAAAARTYTLSKLGRTVEKHPDADVCTDITCCQAYIDPDQAAANWGDNAAAYTAKITSAVSETDGMAVLYDGQPIQAVFFSSAAGRTVDAVEVWGNSVPYLTGVDSPEGDEVPNYHSTVTFTLEEFKSKLLAQYPDADLSGDPAGWFQNTVPNSAGGVEQVDVGGVTVSGGALRTLLGLRSTSFTVTADSQGVTFSVTGYGHGVGMSQYGANALAKQGKTYDEILKWYYTGVEVAPYTPGG